jgi:Tfp pilus assembly protein PilF
MLLRTPASRRIAYRAVRKGHASSAWEVPTYSGALLAALLLWGLLAQSALHAQVPAGNSPSGTLGTNAVISSTTNAVPPAPVPLTNAVVVELEGRALFARGGSDDWRTPKVGDRLFPGDRFRTMERSRAVLRLSDLSLLRLGELSYIELPAPTARRGGLQFLRGLLYYFHRDKPGVLPVATPSAHAVVLGTEFVLSVAENGSSQLTMLDGVVELTNALGRLELSKGESALVRPQTAPVRISAIAPATSMQWILYYPAILDPAELRPDVRGRTELSRSMNAYRQGDLLEALAQFPTNRAPADSDEGLYLATLQLAAGLVEQAERHLEAPPEEDQTTPGARLRNALRRLIALIQSGQASGIPAPEPRTATEWLVESLARQAQSDLPGALTAARAAVEQSPEFAFAWTQLGELAFGSGDQAAARAAIVRSLELAPKNPRAHALDGFLLAARRDFRGALAAFERAIALNGAMADGWLGRGLCQFHQNNIAAGLADLQTAVIVEPQRALPRSYLAKAYAEAFDARHARQEIDLARQTDPQDPTSWLYSALLHQQQNQVNAGIADLERSTALNGQRSLFRSRLLLDQDQAVRGANLARLYQDAGLLDYGTRAASAATTYDYANGSAHLFLANSYNALRDPNLVDLRYETPAVSEYLIANLLAPVGAHPLSPFVSQQEYSPLFARQRFGLSSETRYSSDGAWSQSAAHHGVLDRLGYALEGHWRTVPGHRPNQDLEQLVASAQFKVQFTPATSAYLQASYAQLETGDVRSFYDDRAASRTLRFDERQEPNLFAGGHHQWAPGIHTLALGARLNDTVTVSEPVAAIRTLVRDSGGVLTGVLSPADSRFAVRYRSVLNAWSAELQQVFQTPHHLWLFGSRFQTGELETRSRITRDPTAFPPVFADPAADRSADDSLDRIAAYGYAHWQIWDALRLIGGASYDWLRHPLNFDGPPIDSGTTHIDRFSPKGGIHWAPLTNLNIRAAYTRSLGGVTYDQSVRLEPTQIAGFLQAPRSLLPESRAGLVPGTRFETFHLGLDHRFPTRTYAVLAAEHLRSDGRRRTGIFDYTDAPPFLAAPGSLRENLHFKETSFTAAFSQLLLDEWSLGARYRFSAADFRSRFPALTSTIDPGARVHEAAWMHEVNLTLRYHHSSGFFASGEARWRRQDNRRDASLLRDEDLWQFDVWTGWRLAQRRIELAIGLLNLTDRHYRLNPLNATYGQPHERLLATQLRWSF